MKYIIEVEVNIPKEDSCIGCSACRSEGDYYEYCSVFGHCLNWKGTSWKPTKQCYDNRKVTTEKRFYNMGWQPIETAPKGSGEDGPDRVDHPDYVKPPKLLLFVNGEIEVGSYDWYYHAGYGMGSDERETAWVHSGDDIAPSHWMNCPSLPSLPTIKGD